MAQGEAAVPGGMASWPAGATASEARPRLTLAAERPIASAAREDRPSGAVKATYALFGAVILAYGVSLIVRGGAGSTLVDGWGVAAYELVMSLAVLARGAMSPRDRRFCYLLGTAMCAWALGDFAMTYETLNGANAPTLSLANFLWAGFYPLAYAAVMLLIRRDIRKFRLASYVDGVMAGLAAAALFAAFAFNWVVRESGGDQLGAAVNLVYPLGDFLLFVLVAIGIALLPGGRRARWYVMAAACIVNVTGDVCALFPGLVATAAGSFANSYAWPLSLFLLSLSVWLPAGTSGREHEEMEPGFALPGIAAGGALLVLLLDPVHQIGRAAIALSAATLATAGIRFGISLVQLRGLTEERHRQLEGAAETERESRDALQTAVRDYSAFAAAVADGDLTVTVAADGSQDLRELSDGLNSMVAGLADISGQVHAGVQDIRVSTGSILAAVNEHTESAGQQSAAISETSTTVNEIREAADETARRAREVAERARESAQVSDEGTRAVERIAGAMEEIRERVQDIARDILMLSERTQQIGEITATVNELADRSNLLALNASIEAARAGEHGKGFAVVADEVRHLAEQSKDATAQVEGVLSDIQSAMSAAVQASKEGTKVVEHGLELTGRAGEGIRSLTMTIEEASQAAERIADSAHQQSVGMDQIARAMHDVDEGTTRSLAGAQRSQRAAEDLNELSAKLAALTERYRV